MHQLSLYWTVGESGDLRGGNQKKPTWPEIEMWLEQARTDSGVVGLDIVDGPEIGPQGLQLRSDQGNYLLTLGETDSDDYHVRSFTNYDAKPGRVDIVGDYWDCGEVCTDFSIVTRVFREFFDSGDVSRDLLD
jgi:hypothetical protein